MNLLSIMLFWFGTFILDLVQRFFVVVVLDNVVVLRQVYFKFQADISLMFSRIYVNITKLLLCSR